MLNSNHPFANLPKGIKQGMCIFQTCDRDPQSFSPRCFSNTVVWVVGLGFRVLHLPLILCWSTNMLDDFPFRKGSLCMSQRPRGGKKCKKHHMGSKQIGRQNGPAGMEALSGFMSSQSFPPCKWTEFPRRTLVFQTSGSLHVGERGSIRG